MRPYGAEIRHYIVELSDRIGGCVVVLFGSVARGDYGPGSDVDLLVISDELPAHPLSRSKALWEANHSFTPLELHGYTRSEFLQLIDRRNPIALDALTEGIVLSDDGFWSTAQARFSQVRADAELEKTGRFWVSAKMLRENLPRLK